MHKLSLIAMHEMCMVGTMSFPIVSKLGGSDRVCTLLGITANALRMQAARGTLPGKHVKKLMAEADRLKIDYKAADFEPAHDCEAA